MCNEDCKNLYSYDFDLEEMFLLEDVENRRMYLNDEVEPEIVQSLIYHILRYNRLDKGIDVKERKPIILYINSPGGSLTDGFGLIDCIMASKTPVYTVNLATCYSMGFLIFLAGEKRFAMPSSTYLCHDGSNVAFGSMSKIKDRMEFEFGEMDKYTKEYIVSRSLITAEMYDSNYRKEWYFYPEEAKRLGVVTHIINVDCDMDDII